LTVADTLRQLIDPIVAELGLDLFDFEFGSGQVRVTVDRPGGVDMEAIAGATRAISRALDDADPIAGKYTLEVSSPGLERRLRTPEHHAWAVGQQVTIKTAPTFEGERRLTGSIVAADGDGVVVSTAGGTELRLAYDDIDQARTVFEWGGQPKPGGRASSGGAAPGTKTTKTKKTDKRAKAS
jgi:ribosome maturation factor RimP